MNTALSRPEKHFCKEPVVFSISRSENRCLFIWTQLYRNGKKFYWRGRMKQANAVRDNELFMDNRLVCCVWIGVSLDWSHIGVIGNVYFSCLKIQRKILSKPTNELWFQVWHMKVTNTSISKAGSSFPRDIYSSKKSLIFKPVKLTAFEKIEWHNS